MLIVAINRSGSKGLTIHPVAPATRARFFLSVSLSVVSTKYRRRFVRRIVTQVPYHLIAIHPRHVDVGDDDIDLLLVQDVQPILAIDRLQHLEAGFG